MTVSIEPIANATDNIHFSTGDCSLGAILVAASEAGVCAILLGDDPGRLALELRQRFPGARLTPGGVESESLLAQVTRALETPGSKFDLPLDIRGTEFQRRVWHALREIPAGSTMSYAEVALSIGEPGAARAVAQACAANSLAIAIPCHRVIRGDGSLSGYRWGVERKRALLAREAAI